MEYFVTSMLLNDADGNANSLDPDRAVPLGVVRFESALFCLYTEPDYRNHSWY